MCSRLFVLASQSKSCAANTCQAEVWYSLSFSNRSKEQGGNKYFSKQKPQDRICDGASEG